VIPEEFEAFRRETRMEIQRNTETLANHIKAINKVITSLNLVFVQQMEAERMLQEGGMPVDDETDRSRLIVNASTLGVLSQLNGTMLHVEAYLESERANLEHIHTRQQHGLDVLNRILGYWQWFRLMVVAILILVIFGVMGVILIIFENVQILEGVGLRYFGGR